MQLRRSTPPRTRRSRAPAAFLAAVVLLLGACGAAGADPSSADGSRTEDPGTGAQDGEADEPSTDDGLLVVATTSILGDIVGHLVGDDGEVAVLMPPGADPHGYEPSARDGATLREADLVVANGLGLEEGLVGVLDAVADEGGTVLELAEGLDPIPFEASVDAATDRDHEVTNEHAADEHGTDEHGTDEHAADEHDHPHDPHVWLDPVRMADGVRDIAGAIAAVDTGLDEATWRSRGETYAADLLEVHEEVRGLLSTIPAEDRLLVTNHDSLGYLAARYDLEVIGTVIPGSSTQADTDPGAFSDLVVTVEEAGVPAIFAEELDTATLAEQLASEVTGRGAQEIDVVTLYTDALGEQGSGAETYLGLLRTDAQLITDALT